MCYYDRAGKPISLWAWARMMEDRAGRIVAQDQVGPWWVSTVWLGLDHSFWGGPPLIFETMIFLAPGGGRAESRGVDYQERYPTEDLAREGHARAVAWAAERPDPAELDELDLS